MSALMNCGLCCFLISVWGTVQLIVMSICYYSEVVTLIEDVEEEEYEDYEDFINKTKRNYAAVGRNCLIAAIIYFFLIGASYGCIFKARKQMEEEAMKLKDDEYFCTPKQPPPIDPKKIK